MIDNYDIKSSFNDFIKICKIKEKAGIKIVAFPTGMGKTYGSANSAIQIAQDGGLPIFIAPRIAILKDFEDTVIENFKKAEVIRIISDTELKQVEYYYNNFKNFKKIADNIEQELLNFIKLNNLNLPTNIISLDSHFSHLSEKDIKLNKDNYNIFKIFRSSKNIKDIFRQFDLLKNSLHQEDIRNDLNSKLWKVYLGIIDIFEASNYFYIKQNNVGIYIDPQEIYKIWGFKSFDKQIIKDFFGLTFGLLDIKYKNKNFNYIFTLTSKKSLKYVGRTFEFKQGKLTKISGTDSNKLFFNKYINTFCKHNNLTPVYYIDEADEFYNEIVIDKTKTIHLNNFLFKIKTFFDYSNISSLLSFINKIEVNKNIAYLANDFKELIFNYNNAFTAEKIEELINFFESNKIDFNPTQTLNAKIFPKLNEKIKSNYEVFSLLKNINNKENILFLFLCFLDSLGISDKIEQLKSNEKQKNTLLLGDLYKTIKNSKDFFKSWHLEKNSNFILTYKIFFNELKHVNKLLTSSSLGETIIKNEDFIELAENNKFMFGNDSLSLVEEQIKYLNNLSSVESFSDNALLEINKSKNTALNLSYIFSFLTKVLIRTVQEISVPNEEYEEDRTLDKEMSCHTYLKKMKTAFSSLKKIDNGQFKIKDEDLLFDENYIFYQDKNIINLFTTNYDKNIKFGKPNISSYIQMSNIHIRESPEKELLNYFSIVENNEAVEFDSKSVIFLMSATATINSYYGNFDYEYLHNQFKLNNVLYDATYLNNNDVNLVNKFKNPYVNKDITKISCFDYGIYETRKFSVYDNFYHAIKNSTNKSVEILEREYNKYKLYEFQSFVYSIENLVTNNNINSLFFISQTTKHIISFINFYLSDLLNKSSKLIRKFNKNGKDYDGIFIINKDVFNIDYSEYNLDKDLIIIFYDSQFENKQKSIINSIEDLNGVEEDMSNSELDILDSTYINLKKEIFNEDKYKILLCSSFGSVSKGFNFVTNKNNKDKDFDAINIGMDPFYDNLSQDKDEALVYQRVVAMKDFNYTNNRPSNLNELMDYFYLNRNYLLNKEHLASIARVIIQALGRIERRRHSNTNGEQYLFINNETYKKMEKFYHFYEYDRYINGTQNNKQDNFSSNLSVNNQYLFDTIQENKGVNSYIKKYDDYVLEQIEKNIILDEIVNFLLFKIRNNDKVKSEFKEIWEVLKSSSIFHNLSQYINDLDQKIQPKLYSLIKKYALKSKFPNLVNLIDKKKYNLSDIFFVQFPSEVKIGISLEKSKEQKQYDIVVDYNSANKTEYDFFKLIFNIEKEDFSTEVLKHISWINSNNCIEEIFREKYTIENILYIPQKKIAIEFIKTAISEEIFKNILEHYKFKMQSDIDNNSYELFDFFIKHNNKVNYTAVDIKFWSIATQAINSKNIKEKVTKKTYVNDLTNVKNILCINLFGKTQNITLKDNIYYKNLFIKNQVRSSPNYGKYILNQKVINFLKEEIEK